MVILDVQLWELGTQSLHQGLSETLLVNTLTDVREFKKEKNPSFLMYQPIQICNSWQILWFRIKFYTNFPGGTYLQVTSCLVTLRFTLKVHIGAIITSLYNIHVNRLLIYHRLAHTFDDRL